MKITLSLVAAAVLVSACSHSTTFTSTSTLDGNAPGMKVTLTLNDFSPTNTKGGDGTLNVKKDLASHTTTPEGTYPVHWQWLSNASTFTVSVADPGAGLGFQPAPSSGDVTRAASVFWCFGCERLESGVGDFVWLPGVFSKTN